jgi:hypothetical protein
VPTPSYLLTAPALRCGAGAAKAAKTQSGLTDAVLAVVADTLYVPPDRKALLPDDQVCCNAGDCIGRQPAAGCCR